MYLCRYALPIGINYIIAIFKRKRNRQFDYLSVSSFFYYFTHEYLKLYFHSTVGLLVVLGFNSTLKQYFSLYWAISQKEGGRSEK